MYIGPCEYTLGADDCRCLELSFRDRRDLASLPLLIDIVILAGGNFLGKERIQRNDILLRAE